MEYVLLYYVASNVSNGFNNFDRINEYHDTKLYNLAKFTLIPTPETAFLTFDKPAIMSLHTSNKESSSIDIH